MEKLISVYTDQPVKFFTLDSAHEKSAIMSLFCLKYPWGMFSINTGQF